MSSTHAQFDYAAALYREPPVPLYYLSHDPVESATWACDVHVLAGVNGVIEALSSAWHASNPWYLPIDEKSPLAGLFSRRTPPALRGQATLQTDAPDPFYEEYSGHKPYHLLMGQRIGGAEHDAHPNAVWAAADGANYRWAHRYGIALCYEHQHRYGHLPRGTPQLWTLEAEPPGLLGQDDQTAPAPIVDPDCYVLDADGNYDTPASYRAYYVAHKQPLLKWTRRAPPPWLAFDPAKRLYTVTKES